MPRRRWNVNGTSFTPNEELNPEILSTAFDSAPLEIENSGDLKIHIRSGSDYYATNISSYTVEAIFSDVDNQIINISEPPLSLMYEDAPNGEYIIDVPEFSCTIMIRITINE